MRVSVSRLGVSAWGDLGQIQGQVSAIFGLKGEGNLPEGGKCRGSEGRRGRVEAITGYSRFHRHQAEGHNGYL